jgi:predicted ATP-binding protein involved in virulence
MDKDTSRANRHLVNRAERQDVAAAFQLYKNHQSEGNVVLANQYLTHCKAILAKPETRLNLTNIRLIDFRRFHYFDIDFHNQLTVVIGENGAGKTTIVDGIVKVLSWIASNIEKEGNAGKRVTQADINVSSTQYAEINAEFSLTKHNRYNVALSRAVIGSEEKKDSSLGEIRTLADLYRVVNARYRINLPVFAFYSVDRSRITANPLREKLDQIDKSTPLDAYADCLEGGSNFAGFLEWFALLENQASPVISNTQALVDEYNALDAELQKLVRDKKLTYDSDLWKLHEQKRVAFLQPNTTNSIAVSYLQIVKQAIVSMIPHAVDLFVDRHSGKPELKVRTNDLTVGIGQLSHGQKSVIAMVADLVWRLIRLNPKRENPLEGQGIVIIDEIELHLHPHWQQQILQNLRSTFPAIQFIVTTHSPQVLSTVDRTCIRRIGSDEQGNPVIIPVHFQTRGVVSADILEQIMETAAAPKLQETNWLHEYYQYLAEETVETEPAKQLLCKLINHFGNDHPIMIKLRGDIEFHKLRAKLSAVAQQAEKKR